MGPTFGFTMQEFSMVGGYTENPDKPQNCQKSGWAIARARAIARAWALARDNTVLMYKIIAYVYRDALCSQHFEYGSNYGHVFSVSRPLVRMHFPRGGTTGSRDPGQAILFQYKLP